VEVYISDDYFLQITNLRDRNLWTSLPYTTETLGESNQLFSVKELSVVSSTVKTSAIPSTLDKLSLNGTRITEGTLSSILRRSLGLQTLILRRSGDIYVSDLTFSHQLEIVDLEDLSVHYSPNVNLHKVKNLKLHYGTFMDPRILQEFSAVFNGLTSVALDQTYFNILKRSLLEIVGLNWIRIWKVERVLLGGETELDVVLSQGVLESRITPPVELVKQDGKWRLIKYNM